MRLLKPFIKLLNAEMGPGQIAAGVAAGFALGMSPLASLQSLAIFLCLFLFRIQILAALAAGLLGALVAYVAAPVFDRVGGAILELPSLKGLFTTLYNLPIVPWTRFNNSIVMGSGVAALVLGPAIFAATRVLARKYRTAGTAVKGPIRTGVMVPTLVVLVLVGVSVKLFLDVSLRRALEYVGTQANGAEVDITSLRTNLLAPSIEIRGIQVTDKGTPTRNLVFVDAMTLKMLWSALLRGKAVVDEANVLGVEAYVARTSPGYVVPPSPPQQGPSPVEKVEKEVVDQTEKQANRNVLGDVVGMLGGVDPKEQLRNLQVSLKSDDRIKALQTELPAKKAEWEQRVKALPQTADLDSYRNRLKALSFDPKNPVELARNLAEGNRLIGEINDKVKLVDQTAGDVKGDLAKYSQSLDDLDKLVQEDIEGLQSRLGLPDIDARAFSQALFMNLVEQRIVGVRKYVALARQYMPAGGKPVPEPIVPPRRGDGRTYRFPVMTGYPLFWLKHASVSSQLTALGESSGSVKGELKDITTDPALTGQPMQLLLQGGFPKQNITGVDVHLVADYTKALPRESVAVAVASFPVSAMKLADSPQVRLGVQQARGSSRLDASLSEDEITIGLTSRFEDVKFDLQAGTGPARDILDAVLRGISNVTVGATVKGTLRNFTVRITSNLGDQLAAGFVRQLQAKVDEAKAQVRKLVDDRIGSARTALKAQLDSVTGDLTKGLDGGRADVGKLLKEAQDQVKAAPGPASPLNRIIGR